jgi:hypothetical protein
MPIALMTPDERAQLRTRRLWRYALAGAMAISLVAGAVAARNRTPWSDECWFSSASYNLAKHGFLGTTVLDSASTGLTRIEQRTYWVMPLFLLGEATWYKFFPASLFWTRMFGLLWAPAAAFAFYVFLSKLRPGTGVAAGGTGLLVLSYLFIDNAAFARPDLMCCALGLGGLAVYLVLRERSLDRALFWSNLLVAASGLTHPNGVWHLMGLATLVLWYDRRRLSVRALAWAAAPYVLLGAAWGWYISRDFQAFVDQVRGNSEARWAPALNPLSLLWAEIWERYRVTFGLKTQGLALLKAFALLAYLGAVAGLAAVRELRREPAVRLLLLLLAVYFAGMTLFNQKLGYYLIHILPFYVAAVAFFAQWLWRSRPRLRIPLALGACLLVGVETGGILARASIRSYRAAQMPAIEFLRKHTAPAQKIAGTAALVYSLDFDPRLVDDAHLGLKGGSEPQAVVIEELYRDFYEGWGAQHPAEMRKIRQRLSSYHLAYQSRGYEIYLR